LFPAFASRRRHARTAEGQIASTHFHRGNHELLTELLFSRLPLENRRQVLSGRVQLLLPPAQPARRQVLTAKTVQHLAFDPESRVDREWHIRFGVIAAARTD